MRVNKKILILIMNTALLGCGNICLKNAERDKVEAAKPLANNAVNEIIKYRQMIQRKVTQNWILPADKKGSCMIKINMASSGVVINVNVLSCTGDAIFNQSAENAVRRASPLPVPADKELFSQFKSIVFNIHQ